MAKDEIKKLKAEITSLKHEIARLHERLQGADSKGSEEPNLAKDARYRRGDVVLVSSSDTIEGQHAFECMSVIVSSDLANAQYKDVIVIAIKDLPPRVSEIWNIVLPTNSIEGLALKLQCDSMLDCSAISTIPMASIKDKIGHLTAELMGRIEYSLAAILLLNLPGYNGQPPTANREHDTSPPKDNYQPDLPPPPDGYEISALCVLNASYSGRFSRLAAGPGGLYFACDNSVWYVNHIGLVTEYARIRGFSTIAGLCFNESGSLFVATTQGVVYRIEPNKSGRILAQIDGRATGGGTHLSDVVANPDGNVYVSNSAGGYGGVFKVDVRSGEYQVLVGGDAQAVRGLRSAAYGAVWGLQWTTGSLVQWSSNGRQVANITVADPSSFNTDPPYDGHLVEDHTGQLYVTAGRAGIIVRVKSGGEIFCSGLSNPTGAVFGSDGSLYVIESDKSRILKVSPCSRTDESEKKAMDKTM